MNYEPGMLLAFRWDENTFGVCKVIKVTETRKEPIISAIVYTNWFESVPENLDTDQLKPMVIHMPLLQSAMERSGCVQVGQAEVIPDELRGFDNWFAAWQQRQAGFFDKSIADSVDIIMESMANVDSGGPDSMYRDRLMRHWQQNR